MLTVFVDWLESERSSRKLSRMKVFLYRLVRQTAMKLDDHQFLQKFDRTL